MNEKKSEFKIPVIGYIRSRVNPENNVLTTLCFNSGFAVVENSFIDELFKELDSALLLQVAGVEDMKPSQKLALELLMDSGYVDQPNIDESVKKFMERKL